MDSELLLVVQSFNVVACILGFILFVKSWTYSRKIQDLLAETQIVKKWRFATFLVGLFSAGYLVNIVLVFFYSLETLLVVEGIVFFFGAVFVLIVFDLAYKTYDLIYSIP